MNRPVGGHEGGHDAAGSGPGSIIAAIMATHTAMKNPNEPSWVATPMAIPLMCTTATPHAAPASPSVAVNATAAGLTPAGRSTPPGTSTPASHRCATDWLPHYSNQLVASIGQHNFDRRAVITLLA